jgi:molybdate transport system substrate-binding protein
MRSAAHLAASAAFAAAAAIAGPAAAETVNVAVAANFTDAANEIVALFEASTGHDAVLSFGATGALYTQITQAAPFDILLAADDERPALAVAERHGVAGTVFPYAIGKVVLYSADPALVTAEDTLRSGAFSHVAIANPATAPYGRAAVEAMTALGFYDAIAPKIVQGQNITQTFQFVETGNAELGFVALSQIIATDAGSRWLVPEELYEPIRQDAVLLVHGASNEAAIAFMDFLRGPEADAVIEKFGYGTMD